MGSDIDKIISSYLKGELSKDDEVILNKWLNKNSSNGDQLDSLSNVWKTPFGYPTLVNMDDEQKKIWNRLQNGNVLTNTKKTKSFPILRVALRYAAILFLFLSAGILFWNYNESKVEVLVAAKMVERNNPLGQKSIIHLPDGSTVWLNADSKLTYSSDFNNEIRKIWLTGEAYFEVAKNPDVPFKVFTDDLVITALGTSFNVNAFHDKNTEKIALNSGKIKIECLDSLFSAVCLPRYLNPGDMALFNSDDGKMGVSQFGDQDLFGWKDGNIIFYHASFEEVMEVLARWYNVKFEIEGTLSQEWNYSTTFENEILENVLGSLKFTEKIDYELNGSQVKIKL